MTQPAVREPSPELRAVQERVANAIEWLTANDPTGHFHLWFISSIQPFMPMPAQGDETREAYRRYHKNRQVFERLWREMENRERIEGLA